jgi:putative endopeptidase
MHKIYFSSLVLAGVLAACSTSKKGKEPVAAAGQPKSGEITMDLSYMDQSVRPQDDFFMYANGTWVKNNPIPPSESRWGSFNELEQDNKVKLTKILDEARDGNFAPGSNQQLLGSYYASFTNMAKRNELSYQPIKEDLTRIASMKSYEELSTIVAEQHQYGINSLFGFGVDQDLKDVNNNITYVGQGGIGLPNKDYYFADDKREILEAYRVHIIRMFQLTGVSYEAGKMIAEHVIDVEKQLAGSMMTPAELRVPEDSYNKFTKEEADKMFGRFDFERYVSKVGSQSFAQVVIGQPKFVRKVAEMTGAVNVDTWKDYLSWKTLDHYAGHLDEKFVTANFKFYQGVLTGKTEMKPIEERAISEITGIQIGEALGKLFVEQYYSDKAQQRVNSMVDNLLATFKERIENLSWMSPETKAEALKKLSSIGRKLGFPSKWEDFSDLRLSSTDYVQNVKASSARAVKKNFSELNKPVDKTKWGMPAHMVNAYYHPLLNEIAFPAGIMQAPFFDENAEDAVNYGRIGMVIGHEFVHGFDDMGSKFAADGSFTNWWSESDRKLFEERTQMLGATFAGFCPIDGHCVNPDLTMGENIADLGGITLAYHAYEKTAEFKSGIKKNGFTPAQRFFLSFAQLWKINYTEAELKNRIANDPHSPGMYRVNGPLMNCPEFFAAFDVKEGDKMRNDATKVAKIW